MPTYHAIVLVNRSAREIEADGYPGSLFAIPQYDASTIAVRASRRECRAWVDALIKDDYGLPVGPVPEPSLWQHDTATGWSFRVRGDQLWLAIETVEEDDGVCRIPLTGEGLRDLYAAGGTR